MDLEEYQQLCKRTARVHQNKELELSNWGLGIAGEAGDIASCIKKITFHKNNFIKEGVRENIGDLMWYLATLCNSMGWNFNEILEENIVKLKKRFPEGWNLENAQRGGTMKKWSGHESEVKEIGNNI